MRNPPPDHSLAVCIWPRALPLAEIFGLDWAGEEVRAHFLTLTTQWHARHPSPSASGYANTPRPGQWMWHPPAHRVYAYHTYDGPDDDWLEVTVRLETDDYSPAHYRVGSALSVACRCEIPHARHTIVETWWCTGSPASALDALTAVLRANDQWLADSRHPEWWRRHAGLG